MRADPNDRAYVFRVGNILKSVVTLVDLDYNILEMPVYLLPPGSKPGSVIRMSITKDDEEERRREMEVDKICNKVIKGLDGNQTNKILSDEWRMIFL